MAEKIYARDKRIPATPQDVTATDVDDKRALDVYSKGGDINATPAGLRTAGKITEITVDSTSWTALPLSALTDRNGLGVQNVGNKQIKLNFDNTEPGYVGWIINSGGETFIDVTDAVVVYAKADSGNQLLIVMEVS